MSARLAAPLPVSTSELNCNATIAAMRSARTLMMAAVVIAAPAMAAAAEHPSLAEARALYNAGDYDGAIAAAGVARTDPASADAAPDAGPVR